MKKIVLMSLITANAFAATAIHCQSQSGESRVLSMDIISEDPITNPESTLVLVAKGLRTNVFTAKATREVAPSENQVKLNFVTLNKAGAVDENSIEATLDLDIAILGTEAKAGEINLKKLPTKPVPGKSNIRFVDKYELKNCSGSIERN